MAASIAAATSTFFQQALALRARRLLAVAGAPGGLRRVEVKEKFADEGPLPRG